MMKKTSKRLIGGAGAAVGAAAIGAALYYLYGTESGKKQRVKIGTWMKSAQKEIVAEVKKLKDTALTEENYKKIVKEVTKRYQTLKKLDPEEVAAFVTQVNATWQMAKKHTASKAPATKKKSAAKKKK